MPRDNDGAATDDVEVEDVHAVADDAFNDEDLADGLDAVLDDQAGHTEEGDDVDEEVPGVGADETLDDDDKPAAAKPGVDRGDGRDSKGQFATKAEQDAADAAKAAGKSPAEQSAAAAAAKTAAPAADAAKQQAWEPLQIKADRALFPIDDAKVTRANGHVLIAIPEAKYNQFQHRIGRGIAAERQVREIGKQRRELEFERSAPKPRSDKEIEADLFLATLRGLTDTEGTPILDTLFSAEQLENLKLKVSLAQRDEKDNFAKAEATRREEAESGETWQRTQVDTLVNEAFELVEAAAHAKDGEPLAALKGMSEEDIKEALEELALPVRDKIVWQEKGETFVNNEYLFALLRRAKASSGRPAAPAPTGQPAAPAKATTDATRFNKGQDSAPAPKTTSLKAGRGQPAPARRPTREPVAAGKQRSEAQIAEDEYRAERKRQLSSDAFDDDE